MICLHCNKTNPLKTAHFCVFCGYPLAQPCPYPSCQSEKKPPAAANEADASGAGAADAVWVHNWISLGFPVRARWRCGFCGGFTRFCSTCHRLYRLDQSRCETPDCAQTPLQESPVGWSNARGGEGQGRAISIAKAPVWEQTGVQLDEKTSFEIPLDEEILGLAFRHSLLVWVSKRQLWFGPRRRLPDDPLEAKIYSVTLGDAPQSDPRFNQENALELAHGAAYVLCGGSVQRVDLAGAHRGGSARAARGRFSHQIVTPTRWIGLRQENASLSFHSCGGFDPFFFEVTPGATTQALRAEEIADTLAHCDAAGQERVYLATSRGLWRADESEFAPVLPEIFGQTSLTALARWENEILVWGQEKNNWTLWRLRRDETGGEVLAAQPRSTELGAPLHKLVVMGDYLWVFDNASAAHRLWCFDIARPAHAPTSLEYQGSALAIHALGVEHEDGAWIVFALQEGAAVSWNLVAVRPHFGALTPLGLELPQDMRWSVAIADGTLTLGATREAPDPLDASAPGVASGVGRLRAWNFAA